MERLPRHPSFFKNPIEAKLHRHFWTSVDLERLITAAQFSLEKPRNEPLHIWRNSLACAEAGGRRQRQLSAAVNSGIPKRYLNRWWRGRVLFIPAAREILLAISAQLHLSNLVWGTRVHLRWRVHASAWVRNSAEKTAGCKFDGIGEKMLQNLSNRPILALRRPTNVEIFRLAKENFGVVSWHVHNW